MAGPSPRYTLGDDDDDFLHGRSTGSAAPHAVFEVEGGGTVAAGPNKPLKKRKKHVGHDDVFAYDQWDKVLNTVNCILYRGIICFKLHMILGESHANLAGEAAEQRP